MDYICRLGPLDNSSTASGSRGPELQLGLHYISPLFCLPSSTVSVCYFNLLFPMRKLATELSYTSFTFSVDILNGIWFSHSCMHGIYFFAALWSFTEPNTVVIIKDALIIWNAIHVYLSKTLVNWRCIVWRNVTAQTGFIIVSVVTIPKIICFIECDILIECDECEE